jgi:hypothetical protein
MDNKQRAPQHPGKFAGGAQGPHVVPWDPQSAVAEIQRLNALLLAQSSVAAAMMADNFSTNSTNTGFRAPTVPSAFFGGQQRPFYCFVLHFASWQCVQGHGARPALHGGHNEGGHVGSHGRQSHVGPPVTFHRLPVSVLSSTHACLPCALSSVQGHVKREAPSL